MSSFLKGLVQSVPSRTCFGEGITDVTSAHYFNHLGLIFAVVLIFLLRNRLFFFIVCSKMIYIAFNLFPSFLDALALNDRDQRPRVLSCYYALQPRHIAQMEYVLTHPSKVKIFDIKTRTFPPFILLNTLCTLSSTVVD